ncbi:hypothetical protein ACJ41O_006934 [Fusarium nematophilum]
MSPPDDDWSNITDVNERRKAQNRVAQRNYRTRQKLRIELAEAILYDLPHVRSAVGPKGRRWLTASQPDGQDTAPPDPMDPACAALMRNDKEHEQNPHSHGAAPTSFGGAGGAGGVGSEGNGNGDATRGVASAPDTAHLGAYHMPAGDTGGSIVPELDLTVFETPDDDCIDPALRHLDWMEVGTAWPSSRPMTADVRAPAASAGSAATTPESSRAAQAQAQARSRQDLTSADSGVPPGAAAAPPQPLRPATDAPMPITLAPPDLTNRAHHRESFSSVRSTPESRTPVLTAISRGKLDIARLLITSGAKIDVPDMHGKTHLHLAVERSDVRMARSLLELGADALAADMTGMGALHMAVERNNEDMVRLLLGWCEEQDRMASSPGGGGQHPGRDLLHRCINSRDGQNMTPVHLCVVLERLEILRILLHYGADVNIGCE